MGIVVAALSHFTMLAIGICSGPEFVKVSPDILFILE